MTYSRCLSAPSIAVFATALLTLGPAPCSAQQCTANWKCKVDYGGSTTMDLYVPTNVDASPGIVVSLHYCGGTSANARPWFQSLADKYGFTIIAPGAGGNCFDATPARSGERDAIVKMVKYVITQNHADAGRVFAAGASSGACMTNALLAAYPDVFAGGSVLAGVPAGAWTGGNAYGWTTPASTTAQGWGDLVRSADPGFTGARPRVQLWHGTADSTLNYTPNFPAEVAQWTNVLNVSDANATKTTFAGSQDMWARTTYKDGGGKIVLETNVAQNAPHDLSGRGLWTDVVRFFGLDMDAPATGGGGSGGSAGAGGSGGGSSSTGGTGSGGAATAGGAGGSLGNAGSAGALGGGAGPGESSGATSNTAGSSGAGGPASGGTSGVAGGGTGASGSAPTTPSAAPSDDGGCAIHVATGDRAPHSALGGLLLAGLGALLRRRQGGERD
jgi:acetylxylan esterase